MNRRVMASAAVLAAALCMFSGCGVSNKRILRMQKMEEGVGSPTTIEEYKEAIAKYQERVADLQLAQGQIGIWYKILGTRYLDNKMYGEALKCFEAALQYYPDNQNLYYYVGICAGYMSRTALDYTASGNLEAKARYLRLAESAYLQALKIEERYARALYALGVLYVFELDEPEKAVPYLEKLLTIEKRHTDGMFVLARAYYSTYEFDKAVEMYDKIIATTTSAEKKADAEENKRTVLDASYGL
ncbi:MAG: tetratricopeptide repeat protein [Treponemataceae bacterium]|nr:tetratricopeptide repeat protein [Treponemataceae bacterium]